MPIVISVENLSKAYRLGQIGTGTLTNDLRVWWAKKRGQPNPMLKIGQQDHGNRDGETIWALKDINFKVEQGEVLGIIGRNGAGKTTLLKILAQVTAPTDGMVKYNGRIASLLEVGTGFHPDLTGRENIFLNGAILGMTKEEVRRKFDEIVAFAEVEKFIDTPVKRYSIGMYLRLAFAVAAHLDPEILLVDEVLAVGDADFQKKCLGKMGEVAKEGRTVLFVSHNMGAVVSLCNSGLVIKNGSLDFSGIINDCVDHYTRLLRAPESEMASNSPLRFNGITISGFTTRDCIDNHEGFSVIIKVSGTFLNPDIIIIIEDELGRLILHDQKYNKELTLSEFSGNVIIKIEFPPLHLSPGIYSIQCKILNLLGGKERRVVSDKYPFIVLGDSEEFKTLLSPGAVWEISQNDEL